MKFGFALPVSHPSFTPDGVVRAAQRAEELEYETLWVYDRLLFPANPRSAYAGSPDGSLPDFYRNILDPLDLLNFAAAHTSKIRIGTSILVLPWYNPVMLARRLTTIDVLSGGRLSVGFGLGWSLDEYDAAGVPMRELGKRADEFLTVLKTIWTEDPAEHHGEFYDLPAAHFAPKPVQKPHPPVYLAAFSPAGLQRTATMADGWNPVGVPVDGMRQMIAGMRGMAQQAGRNPDELGTVVRAFPMITEQPLGDDRFVYSGSADQVKADVAATKELGVQEIFFDPAMTPQGATADGYIQVMEQLREMLA